jgi:tripartite-type tricarboxylate transporter receptor subunit TctC
MKRLFPLLASVLFHAVPAAAAAEGPLTLVVPYPPGGFVDNVARALAPALSGALQQPVVIQNRGGANGDIGHAAVANAAPDGRTLLIAAPSLAAQPAIDALTGRRPSFALDSLAPLAQITADPAVFLVHPSLKVGSLRDFLALARSRPQALGVSSSGAYGATHLPVAMLEMHTGARLLHVPAAGGAQALAMALGGHTVAVAAAPSVARPHIASGRLLPLAQSGEQRSPMLPEVPTLREGGVDMAFTLWTAVFVRTGTPAAQQARLLEGLRKAAQDPAFRSSLAAQQSELAWLEGEAFRTHWRAEVARLQATVRHIGRVDEAK